jgi:hypothetical protein
VSGLGLGVWLTGGVVVASCWVVSGRFGLGATLAGAALLRVVADAVAGGVGRGL